MITIKCYYGMRTITGLTVKTVEEAKAARAEYFGKLSGPGDRWLFIAVDENGNVALGSY